MTLKLKETYKVEFGDIDFKGKMTINSICNYMQMLANHHADQLALNYYKNNGHPQQYWILSKVKYQLDEYPNWEENIKIETYPGGYDKLYAVRLFDIYNKQDKKIGHIIGDYLLMDMEKKRPLRIKGGEGSLAYLDFPYEGEKLKKLVADGKVIAEEKRKAHYYELDLNEHMNNSHYVRWAVDMLPLEMIKDQEITTLEIDYNASVTYNVEVQLQLMRSEENTYFVKGDSLDGTINFFVCQMKLK